MRHQKHNNGGIQRRQYCIPPASSLDHSVDFCAAISIVKELLSWLIKVCHWLASRHHAVCWCYIFESIQITWNLEKTKNWVKSRQAEPSRYKWKMTIKSLGFQRTHKKQEKPNFRASRMEGLHDRKRERGKIKNFSSYLCTSYTMILDMM